MGLPYPKGGGRPAKNPSGLEWFESACRRGPCPLDDSFPSRSPIAAKRKLGLQYGDRRSPRVAAFFSGPERVGRRWTGSSLWPDIPGAAGSRGSWPAGRIRSNRSSAGRERRPGWKCSFAGIAEVQAPPRSSGSGQKEKADGGRWFRCGRAETGPGIWRSTPWRWSLCAPHGSEWCSAIPLL